MLHNVSNVGFGEVATQRMHICQRQVWVVIAVPLSVDHEIAKRRNPNKALAHLLLLAPEISAKAL